MKRFILIVFILIPISSFCQEQFPIFSEDNFWKISHQGSEGWQHGGSAQILGDTIIDDRLYKIIGKNQYSEPFGFGYDQDNKTYFRPINWEYSFDLILYDFNLEVGDTFYMPFLFLPIPDSTYIQSVVLDIDSVQLNDGSFRKRYDFGVLDLSYVEYLNCSMGNWTWIDGIGNNIHPVYPIWQCFEGGPSFDCYIYQGEELYGECLYSPNFEIQNSPILISPNPTSNKVSIQDPNNEVQFVELFDINGYRVLSREKTEQINLNEFPDGIYVLKIQVKNGSMVSKKIMKFE